MTHRVDLAVIGSGPAGYVAAIRAAQLGLKTICIEKEPTFGGTCLNVGCIPSKALLDATEKYAFIKNHGATQGLEAGSLAVNFPNLMLFKEGVVKSNTDGVKSLFKKNNIQTLIGTAKLAGEHLIEVDGEQKQVVEAKNILLATGSAPIELPNIHFDEKRILSSTGALSLSKPPTKMVVIGAGVIGVELASVYNRLGTEVVLIEMLDRICGNLDNTVHQNFLNYLTKQGLQFHLGCAVTKAEVKGQKVLVEFEKEGKKQEVQADVVLVAVGRRPFSDQLGLNNLNIQVSKRGHVIVDQHFRTNVPHIYAIGDLIEGPMLAHRASEEGVAAVELIAGGAAHIDYMAIPNIIYTHPEVASLGFTEEEAKANGLQVMTGVCHFRANARARCGNDTDGLVKVIGDKTSGALVGMHIVGPHASELIAEGVMALVNRMTVEQIANASHGHPTLSEAIKEACLVALGRAINL